LGAWYWIGVAAGIGAGVGIVLGSLLPPGRTGTAVAVLLALVVGGGIGYVLPTGWGAVAAGAAGGVAGALASAALTAAALRSGGTRLGVAAIVTLAGIGAAAVAFIPAVGYLVAVFAPVGALRVRRRGGSRYKGLRILAKD
jgi:hypothetical protein